MVRVQGGTPTQPIENSVPLYLSPLVFPSPPKLKKFCTVFFVCFFLSLFLFQLFGFSSSCERKSN